MQYVLDNVDYIIRHNRNIVEMAAADGEAPIFPALAYRELSNSKSELLHFSRG